MESDDHGDDDAPDVDAPDGQEPDVDYSDGDYLDEEYLEEEYLDEPRYESDIMRAKRKHGMAGAIMAGGMFALDQVLGRKPKEQPAAVQEFAGEPTDIDSQGITIAVNEHTTVTSPAPHLRGGPARIVRRRRRGGQSGSPQEG